MFFYPALLTLTTIFVLLSFLFLSIGIYLSDSTLMIISGLFAIASILCRLEMKELALNPFTD